MPSQAIFQWLDGRGWLVFSGGADWGGEIRGTALARSSADGGTACIALSNDPTAADQLLDDLTDLGSPSAYIVDVASEEDAAVRSKLAEAGVIVIATDGSADDVRSALTGAAMSGIQTAYENGAVLLVEGECAMAFGAFIVREDDTIAAGLGWLERALVIPTAQSAAASAKPLLTTEPDSVAIAIGVGSALALGPDGEVETWGLKEVTIALGAQYGGI